MHAHRIRRLIVALATLAFGLAPTLWAEDLPSDDRIQRGELSNGVKWLFRQHDNPPGKFGLMINVDTGSLNEEESQRGLAHFLEHMAFNGSENFPPGELIPYFESIGMEFGADLNAFTSFDQTAYMLFLPDTTIEQLDKALMVLSDYAFRLSLLEEEIDKERGVILSELRAGMSPQQRIRDELWPQLFQGTRLAKRMPIGVKEVIEDAPRVEFVNYYRTWYRPERVTLLMVGDRDLEPIMPLVEKWFGKYQPTHEAKTEQGPEFKPFKKQRGIVVTDPEMPIGQVQLWKVMEGRPPVTTVAGARQELVEMLSGWMMDRRFSERIKKGNATFRSANAGIKSIFNDALLVIGSATGEPKDWNEMLEELIVEVSRAREYGFTEREFQLAKSAIMANAERSVRTEATRPARSFLMEMNAAVNDGTPIMSAAQELELTQRLLPTIKLSEVSDRFGDAFAEGSFAYVLTLPEGKEGFEVPSGDDVLAAAREALSRKPEPPDEGDEAQSLLASEPQAGEVVEWKVDDDLDITTATLKNGVVVHHRFMDYKKDLVLVSISLAGGEIEETAKNAGITQVASLAFNQPATSRLNSSQIEDLMTGKNINLAAGGNGDALSIRVTGSPEDLEHGLQLAYALLSDARIEESAFKNWKQEALQTYEMYSKFPRVAAINEFRKLMSGNDPRQTAMTPDKINAQSLPAAQAWLERITQSAPIEVAVVGEMQFGEVLPLIAKYVGSLPSRPKTAAHLDPLRTLNRAEGPLEAHVDVETQTPQAMVLCGFIGSEAREVQDTRALKLAASILDSRLIKRIRENLGLVYSIGVMSQPSTVYRDSGLFFTGAPCAPETPAQVISEVFTIFDDFAANGPTAEELDNAKKQIHNNLDTDRKEPAYWWRVLQHLYLHDMSLEDEKEEMEAYKRFTARQVQDAFKKYYKSERRFEVVAIPTQSPADADEKTPEKDPNTVGAN